LLHPEQIIIEPLVTEKAVGIRMLSRYVFKVHPSANKISVGKAVENLFKVKVKEVNTCIMKPKLRRRGAQIGKVGGFKKAYVTLMPGQKIEELEV